MGSPTAHPSESNQLETDLQSQLHDPRRISISRAEELTEGTAIPSRVETIEIKRLAIERVEHLPAELHTVAFPEMETLAQPQVPSIYARTVRARRIPPNIPLGTLRRRYKIGGVKVVLNRTRVSVNAMSVSKVRIVIAPGIPGSGFSGSDGEGLSRLSSVYAAQLPPTQNSLSSAIPSS